MKIKIFQLLVLTTFFIQCQNKKEQENIIKPTNTSIQQNINFDDVLKKGDYTWNEDYFTTADYGVIYNQKTNPFGNLKIYLIPKNKLKIEDDK